MSTVVTLPGLIDCHVHFREPGLEHKATMETEALAARLGGVMTVCEMPNTNPPTTTIHALKDKVERAKRVKDSDIRFFFGITDVCHLKELEELWTDDTHRDVRERCPGVKLYFDHSTGNQKVDAAITKDVFRLCAEFHIPLVAHCEDAGINERAPRRPPESEERSVANAIEYAKKLHTRLHIAHLSTAQGLILVQQAKRDGISVTCEAAPHHLFLSMSDEERLGPFGRMNPPLRTRDHQEALWEGMMGGTIDCIATDHAPHTREEKNSNHPPKGVPGVETMLPLLLTVVSGYWPNPTLQTTNYKLQTSDIERLCFENPNKIFSLGKKKNEWKVEVDMDEEWIIHGKDLHSKCGWTPYEGWRVRGKVSTKFSKSSWNSSRRAGMGSSDSC